MKKSTIFAFTAGLAAGVLFNDRIREKFNRFQASINRKTAEIPREKIDQERSTPSPDTGWNITFAVQSISSLSAIVRDSYDTIDRYGCISIANLCEIVGIPYNYADQSYGWNSIKDFRVSDIVEHADHTFTVTVSGARRL